MGFGIAYALPITGRVCLDGHGMNFNANRTNLTYGHSSSFFIAEFAEKCLKKGKKNDVKLKTQGNLPGCSRYHLVNWDGLRMHTSYF